MMASRYLKHTEGARLWWFRKGNVEGAVQLFTQTERCEQNRRRKQTQMQKAQSIAMKIPK